MEEILGYVLMHSVSELSQFDDVENANQLVESTSSDNPNPFVATAAAATIRGLWYMKFIFVNHASEYISTSIPWTVSLVQLVITTGANLDDGNKHGFAPLYFSKSEKVAALFLRHGAELEARSIHGDTPLLNCLSCNVSIDCIRSLLDCGANVNPKAFNGFGALHLCKSKGAVELLLQLGAELDASSISGFTPVLFPLQQRHYRLYPIAP
jgi:ankyrin repeat protein